MSYNDKYEVEYLRALVKSQAQYIVDLQNTLTYFQRLLREVEKRKSLTDFEERARTVKSEGVF